ncbi:hypothetical protein LUTEI9C_50139 [Luteimonas sp. 9C]|nr:hypothetical protein LUTEI9C_50139 [Luteimonas sp. 9C]
MLQTYDTSTSQEEEEFTHGKPHQVRHHRFGCRKVRPVARRRRPCRRWPARHDHRGAEERRRGQLRRLRFVRCPSACCPHRPEPADQGADPDRSFDGACVQGWQGAEGCSKVSGSIVPHGCLAQR